MHDEIMTHIDVVGDEIRIEYGRIGENPFFSPFEKVTVSYVLNSLEEGYTSSLNKLTGRGRIEDWSDTDPIKIQELNKWDMLVHTFKIGLWDEMTLFFRASNKRIVRFAELTFTPVRIRYMWEEKGASSSGAN